MEKKLIGGILLNPLIQSLYNKQQEILNNPTEKMSMPSTTFYLHHLRTLQRQINEGRFENAFDSCELLLSYTDLSLELKATCHSILGKSTRYGKWHADRAVEIYEELANNGDDTMKVLLENSKTTQLDAVAHNLGDKPVEVLLEEAARLPQSNATAKDLLDALEKNAFGSETEGSIDWTGGINPIPTAQDEAPVRSVLQIPRLVRPRTTVQQDSGELVWPAEHEVEGACGLTKEEEEEFARYSDGAGGAIAIQVSLPACAVCAAEFCAKRSQC